MRETLGHAVRVLYFCSGMTDYYIETGNQSYLDALESLWKNMTEKKMYVSGAVGGRAYSESFGRELEEKKERPSGDDNAFRDECMASL